MSELLGSKFFLFFYMYKYINAALLTTLLSSVTIVVTTSMALGADISSCTLKKIPDEQNYCKASFAGSATFCDMIKNGEKKRECYFMVVKIQRASAYQLKKYEPPKSDEDNQRFSKKK